MERYIVSFVVGLTTFILLYTFVDFSMVGSINLNLFLSLVFGVVVALTIYSGLKE